MPKQRFKSIGESVKELMGSEHYQRLIGQNQPHTVADGETMPCPRCRALGRKTCPALGAFSDEEDMVDLVCPKCKDVGWLRQDVEVWDARFGVLYECSCGIVKNKQAEIYYGKARIPARFENLDLTTFPNSRAVVRIRKWFREESTDALPWLVLAGDYGVGKTGLAIGLVKLALSEGTPVIFTTLVDLLSEIKATYASRDGSSPAERDLVQSLKGITLLAIDDVGAERPTGWAQERLYEILNHRYNERRITIMTTNLGDADAMTEHLGARLYSRIADAALIYGLSGPSMRREQ